MSQSHALKIDLLLPYKERFTAQNSGAVSTVTYELARQLQKTDNQELTIFATDVATPKDDVTFQGLTPRYKVWQSRNISFANSYLDHIEKRAYQPDIIEVHGRPQIAHYIARKRPDLAVILYLHNDARTIRGAKTVQQRDALSESLAGIISITHYVKSCFLDGLGDEANYKARHLVNHLGVDRRLAKPTKRQKQIFLAGRMVPEKGFLEACKGALPVLMAHQEWSICLAGGKDFTTDTLTTYEKEIQRLLSPLGERAKFLGHQPRDAVRHYQETSEICIVPSLWQEPGGLTVLEALAAGSALITTNRGGIPEFAKDMAIIVDNGYPADFEQAVRTLVENPEARKSLQKTAWDTYDFDAAKMAQRAAQFRCELAGIRQR